MSNACFHTIKTARCVFLLSLFVLMVPSFAQAHSGTGLAGGLVAGLLHPLSGPDHMAAMIAVGLWGAILGRPLLVILPMVFPATMAVGGVLGIFGIPMPPVEVGIAASAIVLGFAVALGIKAPAWIAIALIAIFALFHGYAHGQELPSAADPVGYSVGFVTSTGALHLLGIAVALLLERLYGVKAVMATGWIIVAAGVWFMSKALIQ